MGEYDLYIEKCKYPAVRSPTFFLYLNFSSAFSVEWGRQKNLVANLPSRKYRNLYNEEYIESILSDLSKACEVKKTGHKYT